VLNKYKYPAPQDHYDQKSPFLSRNYLRPWWYLSLLLIRKSQRRCTRLTLLLLLLASLAAAGINKKLVVQPDTPDGKFLELIGLETDYDKRLALIEQFTILFPQSVSIGWAFSQMQDADLRSGLWDKAIAAGSKLLELDPDDLEAARLNLQAAQAKDDAGLVKRYTDLTQSIARRAASAPARTEDAEDTAADKRRAELASSLLAQQEYALYDQALNGSDPRKRINLLDQLLQLDPHTRYLNDALLLYYLAYRQLNETAKALAAGERLLQRDPAHQDVLLFVADYYFRRKEEPRKVLDYCARIVAAAGGQKKPAALSDAAWTYQQASYSGTALYMAGMVHFNESQYDSADRSLRLALPLLKGNTLLPAAVAALAWSNYQLSKYSEAVHFYKQCLAFGGIYKAQAEKNLAAIKAEHNIEE
jgi:tetratricopeptide (TPR) repeat protein